ncbi:ester cyclase [Chitinophaga pinensis]|uniref:Ester cyclase n=1 Tax=Chitinophaga pinensis TaxID=79329 RepID=A0A5C6LY95_9BACT|nr:ester cyclase [Chitinophaga pinensis]TWW00609.1 ester cyclase [Chitinophaga pinensis]
MKFLVFLSAVIVMPLLSAAQTIKKTEHTMNNKAVIKKMYEEVFNKRDMSNVSQFVSATYPGTFGQQLQPLIAAFPDAQWLIKDMVAEDDKVVVFQQFEGTHKGTFQDIPATGKHVTGEGIVKYELKDGKIISSHVLTDRLGFLQALGAR